MKSIVRQRVIACHLRNPQFTAWQIAQEAKCDSGYVRRVLGWKKPARDHYHQLYDAATPMLPPDASPLPHSAADIWEERQNSAACDALLAMLRVHHPRRAA